MLNKNEKLFKLYVIEIWVKQIRVNQRVGVQPYNFSTRQSAFAEQTANLQIYFETTNFNLLIYESSFFKYSG